MKTKLPKQFIGTGTVKGSIFTQIYENEFGYVYRVNQGVRNDHFEVFYKKDVPICVDFENRIYSETDFKEVYPKGKDFGVWAWTFLNEKKAIKFINSKL